MRKDAQKHLFFTCLRIQSWGGIRKKNRRILKKNGKLYSSLIPQFLKKFSVNNSNVNLKGKQIFRPEKLDEPISGQMSKTLLMQSSEFVKNQYTNQTTSNYQVTLVKFIEQPFLKATKAIGVYAITEDYFEQDVNSVFFKNTEFYFFSKKIIIILNQFFD